LRSNTGSGGEEFKHKPKSKPTGFYVICPGSGVRGSNHEIPILISRKGALFARCAYCDVRLFLYGEFWEGHGLRKGQVNPLGGPSPGIPYQYAPVQPRRPKPPKRPGYGPPGYGPWPGAR